jgi:S1-C subfamily serine protease
MRAVAKEILHMRQNSTGAWLLAIVLTALILGVAIAPSLANNHTLPARAEDNSGAPFSQRTIFSAPNQSLLPTSTPAPFDPNNELEDQVVHLYETARASVVNITNRGYTTDQFMQPVPQQGTGSGFIFDDQGHIVTNFHVVENAEELIVTLADGSNHPATLVGEDPSTDLAVIRLNPTEGTSLPPLLPLAEPNMQRVGQFVIAIGNPFGLQGTLTIGVISSLGRIIESPNGRFIGEAIQTDAAINPGNSGGPLLDLDGRVIGVNSQIVSPSGSSAGIGFAVPVATVSRVVTAIIAQGRYAHPYLGVQTLDIGPNQAEFLRRQGMDVPVDQGLLVAGVVPGGPAEQAGVQAGRETVSAGNIEVPIGGDILTAIDGQPLAGLQDLTVYLESQTEVGDTVTLTVIRNGESQDIDVTLAERPVQQE